MRVQKAQVKTMGPFQGKRFILREGINLLQGEGPHRKAPFGFLSAVLYGPARSGGTFSGSCWFTRGEKSYCLSRGLSPRGEETFFFEEEGKGRLSEEELARVLGETGRASFENQVRLTALKGASGPDISREMNTLVSSYLEGGDRRVNLDKARQFLKMHRKDYADRAERAGKRAVLEQEKLKARMEDLNGEVVLLKGQQEKAREAAQAAKPVPKKVRVQGKRKALLHLRALHRKRNLMSFLSVLGFALFLSCLLLLILSLGKEMALVLRILLGLGIALGFSVGLRALLEARRMMSSEQRTLERHEQVLRKYRRQDEEKRRLETKAASLAQREKERAADLANVQEEYDRYAQDSSRPRGELAEMEAIDEALERLRELAERRKNQSEKALEEKTGEIFSSLTGGEYAGVSLQGGRILVRERERLVDPDRLSRSRAEQLYLSLQLAFSALQAKGEPLPLIGEDLFRSYEEEPLGETLRYLAGLGRQVLLYVTTPREGECLQEMQIPYWDLHAPLRLPDD